MTETRGDNLNSIKVQLPEGIEKILRDKARRDGETISAGCRRRIVNHMVANDEIFICNVCDGYNAMKDESDEHGVCIACRSKI